MVHTESTTSILFAAPPSSSSTSSGTAPVFLNPVQEYNRDLSVVAIRTWSETRQAEKRKYWEEGLRRKWARKRVRDLNGGGDGGEKFARKATGTGEDEGKGKGKEATVTLKEGEADGQADAKRRKAEGGTAAAAPVAVGAGGSGEATTTTTTRVSSSFQDTRYCGRWR